MWQTQWFVGLRRTATVSAPPLCRRVKRLLQATRLRGYCKIEAYETNSQFALWIGAPARATITYAAKGHKGSGNIVIVLERVGIRWRVRDFSVHIV